jgi:hypothetical protein
MSIEHPEAATHVVVSEDRKWPAHCLSSIGGT